jgi:hypothetical protein
VTVAEQIAEWLKSMSVGHVFGIIGAGNAAIGVAGGVALVLLGLHGASSLGADGTSLLAVTRLVVLVTLLGLGAAVAWPERRIARLIAPPLALGLVLLAAARFTPPSPRATFQRSEVERATQTWGAPSSRARRHHHGTSADRRKGTSVLPVARRLVPHGPRAGASGQAGVFTPPGVRARAYLLIPRAPREHDRISKDLARAVLIRCGMIARGGFYAPVRFGIPRRLSRTGSGTESTPAWRVGQRAGFSRRPAPPAQLASR